MRDLGRGPSEPTPARGEPGHARRPGLTRIAQETGAATELARLAGEASGEATDAPAILTVQPVRPLRRREPQPARSCTLVIEGC